MTEVSKEEQLLKNIASLLELVGERGLCRGCKKPIWWIKHKSGKNAPYTEEALNHFADCPQAQKFRRKNNED